MAENERRKVRRRRRIDERIGSVASCKPASFDQPVSANEKERPQKKGNKTEGHFKTRLLTIAASMNTHFTAPKLVWVRTRLGDFEWEPEWWFYSQDGWLSLLNLMAKFARVNLLPRNWFIFYRFIWIAHCCCCNFSLYASRTKFES